MISMASDLVSSVVLRYRPLITLLPLAVVTVGLSWKLSGRKNLAMVVDSPVHRHPTYWFDDGSVIVRAWNNLPDGRDGAVLFKIHGSLLLRHSKAVLERTTEDSYDIPTMTIPLALGVQVQDFTSLLAHLYHDAPLSPELSFQHLAAVLRVSSPDQLDIPSVHSLARSYFISMFPSGPSPFVHPKYLEEALNLALRYNIASIQKGLYYSLVTTTDFEPSSDTTHDGHTVSSEMTTMTPTDVTRCRSLITSIVEHFTPVLFEPPVTSHMECTNLLADKWFPLVVQSALAGDGVCRPLEALEQVKQIDWRAEGLCAACVREKREEWTNEQEVVWEKMDAWLQLNVVSE